MLSHLYAYIFTELLSAQSMFKMKRSNWVINKFGMDLSKLLKRELLSKCEELRIKRCKSKTKNVLIELIIQKQNEMIRKIPCKEEKSSPLNVIDLFCGCGGMSKGLTDAGLNVVVGIDIWDKAINSYKQNFQHLAICEDLTTLPPEKLHISQDIDLIVGGPPCQGFSMAGKRDKKDPRNSLIMEYIKYLNYFNPKAFIKENVIG